jgi:Tfp pilus assembly protein PilF
MSSKRPVILGAILLVALGGYIAYPYLGDDLNFYGRTEPRVAPKVALPAANAISNFALARAPDGRWWATLDYAYTGEPKAASMQVSQMVSGGAGAPPGVRRLFVSSTMLKPGTHNYRIEVRNPSTYVLELTERVEAQFDAPGAQAFLSKPVEQRIQWPDPVQVEVDQAVAAGKQDALVQKAVGMIDAGQQHKLQAARTLLQTLVEKSPTTDTAYVELARIAMKTQWNSDGLRNAEALIGSALQIRPDSANAKILLGYVYANQGRHKEAEKQFVEAAATNPPNLYLYANWGDLLAMEGQGDAAIKKYREGIARPPTGDTYDRARRDIYSRLIGILAPRQDIDGVEALLKQRAAEYPAYECFGIDYARFLILQRGDTAAAQAALRDAPSPGCDDARKRLVNGLAYYVTWSQGKDPERADALRQARAFEPVSPTLFYTLASSDRGAAVVRQLLAAGEKLAMQDSEQFDALAYSLRNGDGATTRRLLRLGASPVAEIGPQKMPAALIPVLTGDFDGIRTMQRAGVDYAKLRFQNSTALDHARERKDTKLLQLLDPKGGKV